MEPEEDGYGTSSPPWEDSGGNMHVLQLIKDCDTLIIFMAECLIYLTNRINNTFVAIMFPFYLSQF